MAKSNRIQELQTLIPELLASPFRSQAAYARADQWMIDIAMLSQEQRLRLLEELSG